jgi:chromosomal replication initiation ATPase DnaA
MFHPFSALDPIPRAAMTGAPPDRCTDAIALIAREKNVPLHLLVHRSRCRRKTARARQLAMYLSHVVLGQTLGEIALAFGRDRTTVSHACAVIEDLRDDPAFDDEVSGYERRLEAARDRRQSHVR